jgi:hypothetical protein
VLSGRSWWISLAATGAAGVAAYVALLPLALPTGERDVLAAFFARGSKGRGGAGLT